MLRDTGHRRNDGRRGDPRRPWTGSPPSFERDGVPERVELEDIHMTVEHASPS
jgi:hypothetical protein